MIPGKPERNTIVFVTPGQALVGPGSIPWEAGNALTVMMKRKRIEVEEAWRDVEIPGHIPSRYTHTDMENVVSIAAEFNTYAHDAYFPDCAVRHRASLLTPDLSPRRVAEEPGADPVNMEV